MPAVRGEAQPSCMWGVRENPAWAALQLLALRLHAGAGTVGSSSATCACQQLCCPGSSSAPAASSDITPALSKPLWGLLPLVNAFLPPFHLGTPVSGNDRRQNGVQANDVVLFSCGFLECGWKKTQTPALQSCYQASQAPALWKSGNFSSAVLPSLAVTQYYLQ